jgi:hypothetical protein
LLPYFSEESYRLVRWRVSVDAGIEVWQREGAVEALVGGEFVDEEEKEAGGERSESAAGLQLLRWWPMIRATQGFRSESREEQPPGMVLTQDPCHLRNVSTVQLEDDRKLEPTEPSPQIQLLSVLVIFC